MGLDGCQFLLTNVFEESVLVSRDSGLESSKLLSVSVDKSVWLNIDIGCHHEEALRRGSP
jgi:hypothetical protein